MVFSPPRAGSTGESRVPKTSNRPQKQQENESSNQFGTHAHKYKCVLDRIQKMGSNTAFWSVFQTTAAPLAGGTARKECAPWPNVFFFLFSFFSLHKGAVANPPLIVFCSIRSSGPSVRSTYWAAGEYRGRALDMFQPPTFFFGQNAREDSEMTFL